MVHVVDEPYWISRGDVDKYYEGKMVILIYNSSKKESGLIAAHSDGNEATVNEDRQVLLDILRYQYKGKGKLVSGYIHDGSMFVCI